jgi:Uma2 family endonuclease
MQPFSRRNGAMLGHMQADAVKRRFTVDEYYAMARAGILSSDDRVELIEGEILTMTPIGPAHAVAVDRAAHSLMLEVQERAVVRVRGPIRLDDHSEPEPDISLFWPPAESYRHGHPRPADVLLVIEIADSSLRYDRDVKSALYALTPSSSTGSWTSQQVLSPATLHRKAAPIARR